jgi:hypothetical protein
MSFKEKKEKRQILIDVGDVSSSKATVEWEPPLSVLKKDIS